MPHSEVISKTPVAAVERRRSERLLYRDLKISYDGCTDTVDVRSPDLTAHGMFINTPATFAVGAELTLRFDLLRTGVIVQTRGEARYCLPGVGVGVKFVDLPAYARAAIEKELEILGNEQGK